MGHGEEAVWEHALRWQVVGVHVLDDGGGKQVATRRRDAQHELVPHA